MAGHAKALSGRYNQCALTSPVFAGTHPLDTAREFDKAGVLAKYYTALPRFRVPAIPRARVASYPILLLPVALGRVGLGRLGSRLNWTMTEAFDRWLSRTLGPCDVFQVPSSFGLRAIRRAKALGVLTVCDHASSHIRIQDELLRDEASRCGVSTPRVDPRFIAKEEAEYDEADVVLVPSTFARQSFLQVGVDPGKVVTVPYGVRLENFFPTSKTGRYFPRVMRRHVVGQKGNRVPARGDFATRVAKQRGCPQGSRASGIQATPRAV